MTRAPRIQIVSSCDQYYFPLLKGLFLSLREGYHLPGHVGLSFLDMGCVPDALAWLVAQGINVQQMDPAIMGELAGDEYGYRRAQTCRAFLPELFPDAEFLVWMDCDMWVQDINGFISILDRLTQHPEKIHLTCEAHAAYIDESYTLSGRAKEMYSYYAPLYGSEVANKNCQLPTFNSGFFGMSRSHSLWDQWKSEISRIYIDDYSTHDATTIHFAEQISLNYLIRQGDWAEIFDPLYNFICLWNAPLRGPDNIVRTQLAPFLPVGVLHLAGGWKHFGRTYFENGLLFRGGDYLLDADIITLFRPGETVAFR